jgi:hypothetical protein
MLLDLLGGYCIGKNDVVVYSLLSLSSLNSMLGRITGIFCKFRLMEIPAKGRMKKHKDLTATKSTTRL